ncbi:hypothetical protein C0995_009709 [Termitomyces sp. Mi166|nr:hypothetical protein C0995_009709 [Termitomyces sp. Mi166\
MTSSPDEHNSAPPGYSIEISPVQSFETRVNVSNDDLFSARSVPFPSSPPRHSDVHFHESVPEQTSTPRRRHTSLPCDSATFREHLRYHYVRGTSISTTGGPEPPADTTSPSLGRTISTRSIGTRLNPTNYVSLSRKSTARRRTFSLYKTSTSITGNYTVNPYLHIPAALLSQASVNCRNEGSRYRKNLRLEVENGGIDVNIFLVGEPQANDTIPIRTTLDLKIKGSDRTTFSLIAKIHTPELPRPAFHLNASGIDGYNAIHIPPSFHGLVTIAVVAGDLDSHISLSRGFFANATIMSETATARSYFVGELGEPEQVEDCLFMVPKHHFMRYESQFNWMHDTDEETPHKLDGIEKADFSAFLKFLHPLYLPRQPTITTDEWASVLKLASKWMMLDIREATIKALDTRSWLQKFPLPGHTE